MLLLILKLTDSNSNNPLEKLPDRLSLSSRTNDYAMNHPANANYPISPSFNVMGPHPLTYPQTYIERENDPANRNSKSVQTDAVPYHSNTRVPTSSNKSESIENLLVAVKHETEEIPQDLSFSKESNTDDSSSLQRNNEMHTRPQIIVSSRKINNTASDNQNQTRDYESAPDYSTCRSPGKSVIVRAGSSNVSKSFTLYLSWKFHTNVE